MNAAGTLPPNVDRARAYVARMPAAVSGQGGQSRTYAVACKLVEFGLTYNEALRLLLEYNARCQPRWTEAELRHKVDDAFKRTRPNPRFNTAPIELTPEQKRTHWPEFRKPSKAELHVIGEMRNLGDDGLRLAVDRGLLWTAIYRGLPCWLVTDATRRVAQARRMDGQPFVNRDGTVHKAETLAGSIASLPLGLPESAPFPNILLVEGGPDMLAGWHFISAESRENDCAVVAMLGSSQRIPESCLPGFANKRIRIFVHSDTAGRQATLRWNRSLKPFASVIDVFTFDGYHKASGEPVADLNDLSSVDADDFEQFRELQSLCP